jgi:Flp pilus assembly protein TadB
LTRLIESQTTQILPGGATLTTLHLSPEARRVLSVGEALISAPRIAVKLPTARVQQPPGEVSHALQSPALGCTIMAIMLHLLGAPALVITACQAIVLCAVHCVWKWRHEQGRRRFLRRMEHRENQ